jgi:hypothetical protein
VVELGSDDESAPEAESSSDGLASDGSGSSVWTEVEDVDALTRLEPGDISLFPSLYDLFHMYTFL